MDRKISVIVPCYNVEEYLDQCLASMEEQSIGFDALELILIDDASADGTLARLKAYEAAHEENVILICNEENRGQGASRNTALCYASAPYVAYVDADDWLDKDYFEKLLGKAEEYDCDIVCCNHVRELKDGGSYENDLIGDEAFFLIDSPEARARFLVEKRLEFGPPKKLLSRRFLLENDIFFAEGIKYEDVLWGNLLYPSVKRVYLLKDHLYHYRENPNSSTNKKGGEEFRDLFTVHYLKWEEWKRRGFTDSLRREVVFDFVLEYYVALTSSLAVRYGNIPLEYFREMQSFIREEMPDYKENPYFETNLREGVQLLIGLLDKELGEAELQKLAEILKNMPI